MTYEEELLLELKPFIENGSISVIHESGPLFSKINLIYPFAGSYIDWDKMDNHFEEKLNSDAYEKKGHDFFVRMCRENNISQTERVLYLNDSAIDIGLTMSIKTAIDVFPKLIELPQHHYFFAENDQWCMAFNMLGQACYGELNRSGS